MPIPTKGRTVTVLGIDSNGSDEHPAVITRAWGTTDTAHGPIAVNLTVFVDAAAPQWLTSVMLFENEELARAWRAGQAGVTVAYWPARAGA